MSSLQLPSAAAGDAGVQEGDLKRPGSSTPRRSVSFGLEDSITPLAGAAGLSPTASMPPTPGTPGTSTPALRSAMKASSSQYKKLPPPAQYQHPDPLLRRLRLVDEQGNPVDLRQHFGRDVKCVGFYFSSQWAGQPLKEYHRTITEFSLRHPNEFKVVYVSVDVDEQWYKAGTKGKPWVSMVWNDGSSPPSAVDEAASTSANASHSKDSSGSDYGPAPSASLYNSEDFLLGGDADIDESLSYSDTSGEAYLRPFSRVHLASKLNIIAAPTLCIYHIPSGKMLDWNVRMAKLGPGREADTWERWRKGEKSASSGISDVVRQRPMVFLLFIFSLFYFSYVRLAGPDSNFIGKWILSVAERHGTMSPAELSDAMKNSAQVAHDGL